MNRLGFLIVLAFTTHLLSLHGAAVAQGSSLRAVGRASGIPAVILPAGGDQALDALYQFKADVATPHLPAELIVLPDRHPLGLKALVKLDRPLPAGVREVSRSIHWQTDKGAIARPASLMSGDDLSTLTLPAGSQPVHLRALLDIKLEQSRRDGNPARTLRTDLTVHKEVALELLTPAPSSMLVGGVIDGFTIGHYLDPMKSHSKKSLAFFKVHAQAYRVPPFFYKVTPEIRNLKIAPHQTLGFWMIDFKWFSLGKTQYIALDLHLVRKIEDLLDLMRANGVHVTHFVPIYGFRPPAFNSGTIQSHQETNLKGWYSMHQYGRALDLIVDEDGDGRMDDLNGDGRIDIGDSQLIMKYVNMLDRQYIKEERMAMVGGAGVYSHHDFVQRPIQTPYIHVDTRGFTGGGGTLIRWRDDNSIATKPTHSIASKPSHAKAVHKKA